MNWDDFIQILNKIIQDPWNAIPVLVVFCVIVIVISYVKAYFTEKGKQAAGQQKSSSPNPEEPQPKASDDQAKNLREPDDIPEYGNVSIEFDRDNEFIGKNPGIETLAFLLNRARHTGKGQPSFTIHHEALSLAERRLTQLSDPSNRREAEEKEYRHLIKVKDFLDEALPRLERAIDLTVNDNRVLDNTGIGGAESLFQYLLGLRNSVFGYGTPLYWGGSEWQSWTKEQETYPHKWYIWWRGDRDFFTQVKIPDEEDIWVRENYRFDYRGNRVFSDRTAFDVYALTSDTFYKIILPEIILMIINRWPANPKIPAQFLDFNQWLFSVAKPKDSSIVPPTGSAEYRKLLARSHS